MTKKEERLEARRLRRTGMSIKAIAKAVKISKSSASVWCRDIILTEEQEEALQNGDARRKAQVIGAKANVDIHRAKRLAYQEEGRQKAREGDLLHLAGCMLYWGEGAKDRTSMKFVNSDPQMMIVFVRFLRETLNIPDEKIAIRVQAYTGNGLTEDEINGYWLELMGLDWANIRKGQFNNQPISSQQKGRKLLYGTCCVEVASVRYMQHVYGAIQEYVGIDKPVWLD
jgi:hypothetical protein